MIPDVTGILCGYIFMGRWHGRFKGAAEVLKQFPVESYVTKMAPALPFLTAPPAAANPAECLYERVFAYTIPFSVLSLCVCVLELRIA